MQFAFILPAFWVMTLAATAQWGGSASFETMYDDNAFRNTGTTAAAMTGTNLSYGYVGGEGTWAANYAGFLATFSPYPDRQYSIHTAGFTWLLPYGADEQHSLTMSGSGTMRFDQSAYAYYDYSQALALVTLKQQLSESLLGSLSYRAKYRSYKTFMDLKYIEQTASMGSKLVLETKTSIFAEVSLGYKHYLTTPTLSTTGAVAAFTSPSGGASVDGLDSGGSGNGNGSGSGNGNGMHGVGAGQGKNSSLGSGVEYIVFDNPTTSQLTGSLNVAQSLGENTGLSLRYLQRWNLQNRGRALAGGQVDFLGEDELFDDAYSYESREMTAMFTQILPWSLKLQTTAFVHLKDYAYPASLLEGASSDLRVDTRMGGTVTLEKTFEGSLLMFEDITVSAGYYFTRNQSNSLYWDYSANAFSLGVELGL